MSGVCPCCGRRCAMWHSQVIDVDVIVSEWVHWRCRGCASMGSRPLITIDVSGSVLA